MRLLLVALLLSDLTPPGDGDWITDYFRWPLCRKRLLLRIKVPFEGLRNIQTACFQGDHKYRTMGSDQTLRDVIGVILGNPPFAPTERHFYGDEKPVPAVHVVSETRHMSVDVMLHHPSMASRLGSLLEESRSLLPVTAAQLRRCLTKRCGQAKGGAASCCPDDDKTKSAAQEEAGARVRAEQLRRRAADVKKRLIDYGQRPVIRRHDTVRAAQLHAGLSAESPDVSKLQMRGSVAVKAFHEDFSSSKGFQKQLSLKTEFSVLTQLLLVSRRNKGPKNLPQYAIRPDDNEYFSGKITTKESEPLVFRGGWKRGKSHMETAESLLGSPRIDHDGVGLKRESSEALIVTFLQETETEIQIENVESANVRSDFPPEKSECRCSDGGGRSEHKEERIKTSDEDVAENAEPELPGTLDESRNDTKEDDSALPATFQLKMIETTTNVLTTATTTTKIPETTRRDEETTMSPEAGTPAVTFTTETPTRTPFLGLRMRNDTRTTLMDNTHDRRTSLDEAVRRHDPNAEPSKPLETTQKETTRVHPEAASEPASRCGGLIARTQAGWKHCMERLGLAESRRFSSKEAPDVRRQKEAPLEASDPLSDDGNDHFYYFDGVMKKVPANFHPIIRRQRLRRSKNIDSERQNTLI